MEGNPAPFNQRKGFKRGYHRHNARNQNSEKKPGGSFENRQRNDQDGANTQRLNRQKYKEEGGSYENRQRNDQDGANTQRLNRQKYKEEKALRFKRLEELADMAPDEIILELLCKNIGFKPLLDTDVTPDTLVLIVKVLVKACSVTLTANKMAIIDLASNKHFHVMLQNFILQTMFASESDKWKCKYFWNDLENFFRNVHFVTQSIFETSPTTACEIADKTIKVCIHRLSVTEGLVSNEIKESFEILNEKLEKYKAEVEIKAKVVILNDGNCELEPPNNFRELTVYPTAEEIMTEAFVRKNIIDKGYNSVDHYLDVQFRLLKEDFVNPLREGVREYLQNSSLKHYKKFSGIKVHKAVKFLSPRDSRGEVGVLVQFESKMKKRKRYMYTKRFMFGSLVCFTRDNFSTLLFGRIIERNPDLLEHGMVNVGFESGEDNYVLNEPYVMIECSVYFEPYYHVLKALQNINEADFPMQKYIINVETQIARPGYLKDDSIYMIEGFEVQLFSDNWPTAAQLELNDSQYRAFKVGLTEEYVIIQGPPGTGKTYIGLKIAKTLIKNKHLWHNGSPILVICYTNHALDQFLEDIITTTSAVIRVGGQSKNKNLEKFKLMEKRKSLSRHLQDYNRPLYALRMTLRSNLQNIKQLSETVEEIKKCRCIIDFQEFTVIDPEISESWFYTAEKEDVISWLTDGRTSNVRMPKKSNAKDVTEGCSDREFNVIKAFEHTLNNEIEEAYGDDVDIDIAPDREKNTFLLTLDNLDKTANKLQQEIESMEDVETDELVFSKKLHLLEYLTVLKDQIQYIQGCLEKCRDATEFPKPKTCNLANPQTMTPDDRWALYFYWLRLYELHLINNLVECQTLHKNSHKQYVELQELQDIEVMKEMDVVGMTTTSAARLQTSLQNLRSPIVIVEEAAEVLEAHIVVSLTKHCKHVILIGDHKQLRPSTASFAMEVKYALGISLFERMVRNNIQCHTLDVQHRMRPEIAKLIVPSIYPKLDNHPSVENFPSVTGVDRNLYFITHSFSEDEVGDSKANKHEARFLIGLAKYLILNGYKPEDITILAAYLAQMFELFQERANCMHLLENVRITVLDNYQGEESKIILLSLVRSNEEGKIGFLKTENRVCVALSRAREGFYTMGNMDLLCRASQVWPKIRTVLEDQECIGPSLTLRCQLHPTKITKVTLPTDFINVSEGGCNQICNFVMKCSHVCQMVCHVRDREHETVTCKYKCKRFLCEYDHLCPKLCYENCGRCMIMMKRILKCNHEVRVACSTDLETIKCMKYVRAELPCGHVDPEKICFIAIQKHICPFPCETRVEPCGHSCTLMCHRNNDPDHLKYKCKKQCVKPAKECSTGLHNCRNECYDDCSPCEIMVEKRRTTCSHRVQISCNANPDKIVCMMSCRRLLPCQHACKKKCSEPCGNCKVMVSKEIIECGHKIKVECSKTPTLAQCHESCSRILRCGHTCQNKCNEPCTEHCMEMVTHTRKVDCAHDFKIPCSLQNGREIPGNSYKLLQYCDAPCNTQLKCEHFCSGTCGTCAQGRVHATCLQKCGRILICGHECLFPCREACQPCNRECPYKCTHSACGKKCGEPCTKCVENCLRRCEHLACSKKCSDICTVPPCIEPCKRKLPCSHPCVGFCGDPCPPLCRVCNYDELTETLFGTEDEEDSRFVLLNECNHVLESSGMEQWLTVDTENEINYKCCPKCKTPITSTLRYSDYVKKNLADVIAVKFKSFGNHDDNKRKLIELNQKLDTLKHHATTLSGSKYFERLIYEIQKSISPENHGRRQTVNIILATAYLSKIQILEDIVRIYIEGNLWSSNIVKVGIKKMDFLLRFLLQKNRAITNQVISDLQQETKRFRRIVQIIHINENPNFRAMIQNKCDKERLYVTTYFKIFSIKVYNDSFDKELEESITQLGKAVGTARSTFEFQQVIQAMGMEQGHWFKCPNGHIYAIGECGGAMQTSKCADCGESIGGSSHSLLRTNRHAGEVDGSSHAAWSETANNLFNYEGFR